VTLDKYLNDTLDSIVDAGDDNVHHECDEVLMTQAKMKDQAHRILLKVRALNELALSSTCTSSVAGALDMLERVIDLGGQQVSEYLHGRSTVVVNNVAVYSEPRRRSSDVRKRGYGE
jgi:hypothetical protein